MAVLYSRWRKRAIVNAWHSDLKVDEVADEFGLTVAAVKHLWKKAKQNGSLPSHRRITIFHSEKTTGFYLDLPKFMPLRYG